MNALQAHRGPDGSGVHEDARRQIALAHVRLAVLDPTDAAAQPMVSPDGRFILIFNGEIYNFKALRQELEAFGHQFVSTGDTEVLLRGLMQFGESLLPRLNGMFAFAFWDSRERILLLARDPLGIKPLYFAEPEPGTLLFASEIKALCAHPKLERRPDFVGLQQHLAYCHASNSRTALLDVKRLSPAHCLRWRADRRRLELRRYCRLDFREEHRGRKPVAATELRSVLREATVRQMVSDVPVGAFLSGGLDSSVVTALAAQHSSAAFDCFTIRHPGSDNQLDRIEADLPHARALAARLGLPFHEIELRPAMADLLPRIVWHLDEPIADPAAIASYLICKLAYESGTKVLLSGQGGDELFLGYPRYRVLQATGWLHALPMPIRAVIAATVQILPGAREGRLGAGLRRIRRALSDVDQSSDKHFLALCSNTPAAEIARVLGPAFKEAVDGRDWYADCLAHMEAEGLCGMHRPRERDLGIYLPNHNLLYTDKTSMAVGVEARVPLLDLELVQQVTHYPAHWLLRNGGTKQLLRQAARGLVPQSIIDRPKSGFGAPYRKWLRYDLVELLHDLTSTEVVRRRGWFEHRALQDAQTRSEKGKDDLYMLQWAVLTIELWARAFIDQNPAKAVALESDSAKPLRPVAFGS